MLEEAFKNFYWIGGSPCSGKSTISEMLISEYGFELYKCDEFLDKYIDIGAKNKISIMKKYKSMTLDEIWLRDVKTLVEDEFEFYKYASKIIKNDLRTDFSYKRVIIEGAAIIPDLIKKLQINKNKYICIVPTKKFQIDNYSKREWVKHYLSTCSNSNKAFENWMNRDALFAKIVLQKAKNFNFNTLLVNGKKSIEEIYLYVKKLFEL
jgi:uridine kinase